MNQDPETKYELQAIFDLSKALNSSLDLKSILDTLLLTLMGKFLISKGLVLVGHQQEKYIIEACKGLPRSFLDSVVHIDDFPLSLTFTADMQPSTIKAFLKKNDILVVVPVRHNSKNLGLIGLGKKSLAGEFSDTELDYLNSLANISATSIQNGLIFRQLDHEKRKSDKSVQELNTLSEIVRELNSTLSKLETNKVVSLLVYSIMGEMMVNRCAVFLAASEGMTLSLNKGIPSDNCSQITGNNQISTELASLKEPILIQDYQDGSTCDAFTAAGIAALIPMKIENENKGVIAIGGKITRQPFSKDELRFLSILGDWSVISIETARLIEQELQKKAMDEEMRIAGEIQRQLLPDSCLTLEGYEVEAVNNPSRQVGGDYFDFIKMSNDEYMFCIADVSGKGTPASLLMANVQASLHALADTGLSLTEITTRINKIIYENTTYDKFITFFVGILNLKKRSFTSVNAGHNPPYLYHADGTFETFDEGGLILGMMPEIIYKSETVKLASGDCIVMFTDGVSEAMNVNEEEYEEHRIEKCIADNFHLSTKDLLKKLLDDVASFSSGCPQADDITALLIKVK